MGDKGKKFNFTVSVINGRNTNLPFKIGEIQYEKPTTITLSDDQTTTLKQVPVGATVTITEDDYSNDRYTPSYAIDGKPSGTNNREAKITSISKGIMMFLTKLSSPTIKMQSRTLGWISIQHHTFWHYVS